MSNQQKTCEIIFCDGFVWINGKKISNRVELRRVFDELYHFGFKCILRDVVCSVGHRYSSADEPLKVLNILNEG